MKFEFWLIIIILIAVIVLLSSCSVVSYVPYYKDSRYLKAYPYEGFENKTPLQPASASAEGMIDSFSNTKGSIDCIGDSNSLYNSMGGLCLSDAQKKLLQTRGGNLVGYDSTIGK